MADTNDTHKSVPELSFGQPFGAIVQVAYVVEDLHRAMREFTQRLAIGPWFYADAYDVQDAVYHGQPTDMRMGLALGFSGHMCFELIQMLDDRPSVYRDIVNKRGWGFHHLGMATRDYEGDVARYRAMGYDVAFGGRTKRGIRFAYLDTSDHLPGMLELIEFNEHQDRFYGGMHQASLGWDGTDPYRRI